MEYHLAHTIKYHLRIHFNQSYQHNISQYGKQIITFSLEYHENMNIILDARQKLIKLIPYGFNSYICKKKTVQNSSSQITQMFTK